MATVYALWVDHTYGLGGAICAIVKDGVSKRHVYVSSVEKWNLGPADSLRRGWVQAPVPHRIWVGGHRMATSVAYLKESRMPLKEIPEVVQVALDLSF